MTQIRYLRRAGSVVLATAASLLSFVLCAPSAFALIERPVSDGSSPSLSPGPVPTTTHLVNAGMAGWQIALISVGAAVLVATLAVVTDRARAAQRQIRTSAT